ncbi:MAG: 4Fe-4S ferredoxin N-terminal domain-containing protein [Natronomonas sp.]
MSTDPTPPSDVDSVEDLHTEAWEERMESLLEGTDHDTELGIEMAKDAQRLVAGELSEAEFYDRYHDAVVEEFGVDDRPVEVSEGDEEAGLLELLTGSTDDGPGPFERLAEADEGEVPRREVMKKAGAGAALLGAGTAAAGGGGGDDGAAAAADHADGAEETQWGMVIDLNKCDGCLACVTACSQENHTEDGANWMYVFTYEEPNQDGHNFLVRTCQHCSNAPCQKVCPTTARHIREDDGLVLTDYDVCIGCRYCQVACPYGVNYFAWEEPSTPESELDENHVYDRRDRPVDSRPPKGVMGKCTMCPSRQDGQMGEERIGTTACEQACAMDAIHFGDMNDPESDPNRYLERAREEYRGANELQDDDAPEFPGRSEDTASTFRLLEELGTDPNVVFVGNEPGPSAEQVAGPVAYEDVGEVDRRKEVLDDGTFGGGRR